MKSLWLTASLSLVLCLAWGCDSKSKSEEPSTADAQEVQAAEPSTRSAEKVGEVGAEDSLSPAPTVDSSNSEPVHEAPRHAAPDQDRIDSIKEAKLKKKKR